MISLPMRPQAPHLPRQGSNGCHASTEAQSAATNCPQANATTMSVSMMPSMPSVSATSSAGPSRPKLSLQTSSIPLPFAHKSTTALSLSISNDSPTVRNTFANAFEVLAVEKPEEAPRQQTPETQALPRSSSSSATFSTLSQKSPFSTSIPYTLPIGAHSILRNSPLPKRIMSATSARTPRVFFPPVKRVLFHEQMVQIMPTPIVEASESSDSDSSTSSEKRRHTTMEDEDRSEHETGDIPSTPVQGRRKRRREWVWTLGPTEGSYLSKGATESLEKEEEEEESKGRVESTSKTLPSRTNGSPQVQVSERASPDGDASAETPTETDTNNDVQDESDVQDDGHVQKGADLHEGYTRHERTSIGLPQQKVATDEKDAFEEVTLPSIGTTSIPGPILMTQPLRPTRGDDPGDDDL